MHNDDATAAPITVLACRQCGTLDPGPREYCANCYSADLEPREVPGEGTVLSWTVIRRPPAAFRSEAPYSVAVVTLDCGVKVTGRLAEPEGNIAPGAAVTCVATDKGYPVFKERAV